MHTAFLSFAGFLAQGTYQSLPSILAIAGYVLTALALYSMAQRRHIAHAWLSWLPVADTWILGSLSDQYRYVAKGQVKSKRKLLLTLSIISAIISTVLFFLSFHSIIGMLLMVMEGIDERLLTERILSGLMRTSGVLLLTLPLLIWKRVLEFMAIYDIYQSCEPSNAVMYLVLCILFPMIMPIFLFAVRDKEQGMPPRRQESPCPPSGRVPPAQMAAPAEEKAPEEAGACETVSEEVPKSDEQDPEYL